MRFGLQKLSVMGALLLAPLASAQVSISIRQLVPNGGRVSWYKGPASHDLIAFDAASTAGQARSDVYTITASRTDLKCVTCGSSIPVGFIGQPAWHANGDTIIVQAESSNSAHTFYNSVLWGFDNDLWVIKRDGTGAERVWATQAGWAVLHPQFSQDGTKLIFAERQGGISADPYANWRIRIADVDLTKPGLSKLSNLRTIQPNGPGFYETHEFAPGGRIIFSYAPPGSNGVDDIYTSMLDGSSVANLTNAPGSWDEHGHLSPTNPRVMAFMSSRFDPTPATSAQLRSELYLTALGGTALRVTQFNQAATDLMVVKDLDWDRTGTQVAFLVSGNKFAAPQVWIVTFAATPAQ